MTDTLHAARLIAGNCPRCHLALVVLNNYEVWPPMVCPCGWAGATTEVDNYARVDGQYAR